jgi:hypothetical protein
MENQRSKVKGNATLGTPRPVSERMGRFETSDVKCELSAGCARAAPSCVSAMRSSSKYYNALDHLENRRTLSAMGSPTQKICMITPIIIC